jgi:TP901 family phage tail tape measure protein
LTSVAHGETLHDMAERQISVVMESRYKSNLSAELRRDKKKIDAFQAHLMRRPLNIPVKLDLKGAVVQAAQLRKTILGELARIPSGILGADGRPATGPTSGKQMNKTAGVLSTTEFQKFDKKSGQWITDQVQMVEQLGRGVTQLSKFKGASGEPFATVTKDISNIQDLRDALRGMNAEMAQAYGKAKGKGDKNAQIQALSEQRARLNAALQEAAQKGLANTSDFQRAENQITRIGERIAGLEGGQESAASKQSRKDRTREIANSITMEERRVQKALKGNKLEMDAAERIGDRSKKEAEVNRLFDERKKIFEESRNKFRDLDVAMQGENRPDLADRALRRGLGMDNQAEQAGLDKQRAETDRMRENAKEQEKIDKANQARAEKAKRIADKAAAKSGNRNFSREMRLDDHATKQALLRNDAQQAAAKAIPDQSAREAELNRVLSERSRIYSDQENRLQKIQQAQVQKGNVDNAAKAEAAMLKSKEAAGKVAVDQTKADAASQISAEKEAEARKVANKQAAMAKQREMFNHEMQDIKAASAKKIAAINTAERNMRASAKNAHDKNMASQLGHEYRVAEYGRLSGQYRGVEARARGAGQTTVADSARGAALGSTTKAAQDMQKFASASSRSGHALNFHSNALLRNAATFAKWMIPVQAVIGLTRAFTTGLAGAMRVDKQFAMLQAVFRGTAEEAQRLKEDTLALGASQGRSADEAMDAAIRWSRLGLNRIQINTAVRTSLMAANVAEMTAAETAEKLSAIYATYRLNVGDLPIVLSRLNAISNRYNVTNKDLMEGIVRVAGVANQAGMSLRDLEGMIGAVTGATGRPGQEVGNALKFVITRLASPETMKGLKDNFDIDLTGPNGDLKDMSQIFRELAQIYPTLNNAQKQLFLKMTAGSRQAARFALVLDQYRQGQILAMEAAFDSASAFEENEKILASLQSRVDSLKTSWTNLFTAWGDAGGFDFLEKRLRYMQSIMMQTVALMDDAKVKAKDQTVNNPLMAERIEKLGGGENAMFGTRSDFSEEEVKETARKIREAISKEQNKGWFANKMDFFNETNPLTGNRDTSLKVRNGLELVRFRDIEQAKQAAEELDFILEAGSRKGASGPVESMANEVNALRQKMEGLEIGANVMESISLAATDGGADMKILTRDFEKAAHGLLALDDGTQRYTEVMTRFYELANTGDVSGISAYADEVSRMFSSAISPTQKSYDAKLQPALDKMREMMKLAEDTRKDLIKQPVPKDDAGKRTREDQVEEIQKEVTMWQGAINQLLQIREKIEKSALGPKAYAGISNYIEDLKKASELIGNAFQDFAPDADNDPVVRIFERRRTAARLYLDSLKQTESLTKSESDPIIAKAQEAVAYGKENLASSSITEEGRQRMESYVAENQKIIDQRNEMNQTAETAVRNETEKLKFLERELEIQEQIANLQRISQNSGRVASDTAEAYRFGATDSDKDINQTVAVLASAKRRLEQAGGDWKSGRDDPASRNAAAGQILQEEAIARKNIEDMTTRQYQLEAARKQVAFDTLAAMREQREEASKRLALASREDQLRAAALSRTIRDKGGVRDNEFFALSQDTRQAFTSFLPNQAPDFVNDAKIQAAKSYREIDEERVRLASTIGDLRGSLDELAKQITEASARGRALDVYPQNPGTSLSDPANKGQRDQNPVVNYNIGDVNVSVAIPDQIKQFMQEVVTKQLNEGINRLRAELNRPPAPNPQGFLE